MRSAWLENLALKIFVIIFGLSKIFVVVLIFRSVLFCSLNKQSQIVVLKNKNTKKKRER